MPSPREVRESNASADLLAKLKGTQYEPYLEREPERVETKDGSLCIQLGEIQVMEGEDPAKPVIRDSRYKRALPGSGRMKRKPKTEVITTDTSYRETKAYKDYRERFAELFREGDPDEIGTDAWWYDRAIFLALGSPTEVDCPHPELHGNSKDVAGNGKLKHVVIQKPSEAVINQMLRQGFGNAPTTVNINKNETKLTAALEYRVVDVRLQGFDVAEATERKQLIESFGYDLGTPVEAEVIE